MTTKRLRAVAVGLLVLAGIAAYALLLFPLWIGWL